MSASTQGIAVPRAPRGPESAARGARRALAAARRLFPWTRRGLGVVAVAALGIVWLGVGESDLIVLAIGATALAVCAVVTVAVIAAAWWLRRRFARQAPERAEDRPEHAEDRARCFETGAGWPTDRIVPAFGRLPFLQLEVAWEDPAGAEASLRDGGDGALVEWVVPQRRFLAERVDRVWTVRDVLGLAEVSFREGRPLSHWALPRVGRLRETPIVQAQTGADGIPWPSGVPEGDRMELRRYAPGDSARDVIWNVYARTRQLHVRLRERAVEPSRRLVAYLVAGEGDEASAAAARVALESGAFGDEWTFGADGTEGAVEGLGAALAVIARSGSAAGPCGLDDFLRAHPLVGETACVLFVPPGLGPWLTDVVTALASRRLRVSIVIGVDRLRAPRPERPVWQRFAWEAPVGAASGVLVDEVEAVSEALAGVVAGTPAVVVRESGRVARMGVQPGLGAAA